MHEEFSGFLKQVLCFIKFLKLYILINPGIHKFIYINSVFTPFRRCVFIVRIEFVIVYSIDINDFISMCIILISK